MDSIQSSQPSDLSKSASKTQDLNSRSFYEPNFNLKFTQEKNMIQKSSSEYNCDDFLPMPDLEAASQNVHTNESEKEIEKETEDIIRNLQDGDVNNGSKASENSQNVLSNNIEEGGLKTKPVDSDSETGEGDNAGDSLKCQNCDRGFESAAQLEGHDCCTQSGTVDKVFLCQLCKSWSQTLEHLFKHLKSKHKSIEIRKEYRSLLYNQREIISKVKNTALNLIRLKKYKAVTRLLNSSKDSLQSFQMDLFGLGMHNVFKKFISLMYGDVQSRLIKERVSQKIKSILKKKEEISQKMTKAKKSLRKEKRRKKLDLLKKDKQAEDQGFSSEDDLCLMDCVVKNKNSNVFEDGEVQAHEGDEACVQFYAVPYNESGDCLSLFEVLAIRKAVKQIWAGRDTKLEHLSHVIIKRFEREIDEVLPDDVVFCGYASKGNPAVFNKSKKLTDLFTSSFQLNDPIQSHKAKELELTEEINGKSDNESVVVDIVNNEAEVPVEMDPGSDEDDFDDGFEKETAHLTEEFRTSPAKSRKRRVLGREVCDVCSLVFTSENFLIMHVRNKHPSQWVGRYTCAICHNKFVPRSRIIKHERTEHSNVSFECELCCLRFLQAQDKENHFNEFHLDDNEFACGVCKNLHPTLSDLKTHFEEEHCKVVVKVLSSEKGDGDVDSKRGLFSREEEVPMCLPCNRKFTSPGRLQQHKSVFHEGKKFRKNQAVKKK